MDIIRKNDEIAVEVIDFSIYVVEAYNDGVYKHIFIGKQNEEMYSVHCFKDINCYFDKDLKDLVLGNLRCKPNRLSLHNFIKYDYSEVLILLILLLKQSKYNRFNLIINRIIDQHVFT